MIKQKQMRFSTNDLGKRKVLLSGEKGTLIWIDSNRYIAHFLPEGKPAVAKSFIVVDMNDIDLQASVNKPTDKFGEAYYKNTDEHPTSPEEYIRRIEDAQIEGLTRQHTYKNPYALQYLYYSKGHTTAELAEMFRCDPKTICRWMNYYGFGRRSASAAQFVANHGINNVDLVAELTYNPCFNRFYL